MSVEDEVKKIIMRIVRRPDIEFGRDTSFKDLKADSLDIVQIMTAIENMYDIEMEDEALLGIANIGDFIAFIERKIAEKA